ncbi:MAG: hypothetical protein CMN95_09375 [Synechococcus sp. MED650]|nr:hypothetical protein [Synechococcus sp. MED650]
MRVQSSRDLEIIVNMSRLSILVERLTFGVMQFRQLVIFVAILIALNFFLDLHISIIGSVVLSILISFVMNRVR